MANLRLVYRNVLEQVNTRFLNGPSVNYADGLGCTSGLTTITRKTGAPDFTTAGVKFQSLLGGTISARFPGGTRVTNVTGSTLTMSAAASSGVANNPGEAGSFNPTQGLIQTADGPMSNLFDGNLHTVWDPGVDAGGFGYPITIVLEFDLVGSTPITLYGVVAPRTHNRSLGGLALVEVERASTYGSWTPTASFTPPDVLRDNSFATVLSSFSARYWRWLLSFDQRCDLSGLWQGIIDQDLGGVPVGTRVERIRPASVLRAPSGRAFITRQGPDRRVWRFPMASLTLAERQKLDAVFQNQGIETAFQYRSPMLLDHEDAFYPVEFEDQRRAWDIICAGIEAEELVLGELT